jgi:hypothetical protein
VAVVHFLVDRLDRERGFAREQQTRGEHRQHAERGEHGGYHAKAVTEHRVAGDGQAGADEEADRGVQQLAAAQDDPAALLLAQDVALDQVSFLGVVAVGQLLEQRPGSVDHPRQAVVGRQQQRGGRGQEERGGQHRGQDRVVGEGGVLAHRGGVVGRGRGL